MPLSGSRVAEILDQVADPQGEGNFDRVTDYKMLQETSSGVVQFDIISALSTVWDSSTFKILPW